MTVVGHAATISAGEWITAAGEWVNDRTHGQRFKTRFMRSSAPTSIDGIEKYLCLDPKNREAIFGIVVSDAFDEARQDFLVR